MASLRVYDTWELLIKFPVHLGALKEKKINSVHDSFYINIWYEPKNENENEMKNKEPRTENRSDRG